MNRSIYIAVLLVALLGIWFPTTTIQADTTSWTATYRIHFSVEGGQPVTRLIVAMLDESLNPTGEEIVIELPCDVIGDVMFEDDTAFFNGGYLVCSHESLSVLLDGLIAIPIADLLDANGIYFDSTMTIEPDPDIASYPIMSYDNMRFSLERGNNVLGKTLLSINGSLKSSHHYALAAARQASVYQMCPNTCSFLFETADPSGNMLDTTLKSAALTYEIDTQSKTFYLGFNPDMNSTFQGEIKVIDFDPAFCRCHT